MLLYFVYIQSEDECEASGGVLGTRVVAPLSIPIVTAGVVLILVMGTVIFILLRKLRGSAGNTNIS